MDTKEMFERKGFDSKSVEFLNGFLYEFNDLYSKYLSQEEVIQRINDYLDEIEFVDEMPEELIDIAVGCYYPNEKKVLIKKMELEDKEKSTFFHEMIHVLRQKIKDDASNAVEDSFYNLDEEDNDNLLAAERLNVHGIDEGFTQYLTIERNAKYSNNRFAVGYPILTKQAGFLMDLIGKDTMIQGMFSNLENIVKSMKEKLNCECNDITNYARNMNVIWKYEHELEYKKGPKTREERLLDMIFGDPIAKRIPSYVEDAQNNIVKLYLQQKVNNIEEFQLLLENAKKYAKSLGTDFGPEMFEAIYKQYRKHPEFNLEESNPKLCETFKIYDKLQEFYSLSFEEKLQFLVDDKEFLALIYDSKNSYAFKKMVVQHMYDDEELDVFRLGRFVRDDHQLSDYSALYGMLTTGLLKEKIQSGEVKPETLALEWIENDDYRGAVSLFNIFNASGTKEEYMGTYLLGGLECDEISQYEIAHMSIEERKKQVSRICQDVYKREMTDEDLGKYLFLCDSNSKKLTFACSLENKWMNIEIEDEVMEIIDKPEYISSIAEEDIKRAKRFINMGIDGVFLTHLSNAGIIQQSVIDEYLKKLEKQYLTPDDIEVEVDRQNVTIGEIKKKVEEFAERVDKKKQGNNLLINGGEDIDK